jgi:hypothetical protein
MTTCTSVISPFQPVQRTQRAGANRLYEIDLTALTVAEWTHGTWMPANGFVRPTTPNGYFFGNTTEGQTGNAEPAWTTSGPVTDGSLTWTPVIPPASGGDTIASVTWIQQNPPDATLTISGKVNTALTASAYIGGGTSGGIYTIIASITMASGAVWPVLIYVTIL